MQKAHNRRCALWDTLRSATGSALPPPFPLGTSPPTLTKRKMAAAAAAATGCCPGSCPSFAVVCSFLERYGGLLDLPELTFSQLERALQETNAVPKPLVELHLKLMRKIGKSVSADRWEKYLIKICQEFNSTWAWELEKKGYQEMTIECKLGILKYLCECQFDDNLKFKNIINEEDPDAMRLQPIGRDKDGLMYWYQLDQDHNVRVYIEEQDDQDDSSWKCIVKSRDELAETLELLKAQIDPALLNKTIQQDDSSRTSPNLDDEDKKEERGQVSEDKASEARQNVMDQQERESDCKNEIALPPVSTSLKEETPTNEDKTLKNEEAAKVVESLETRGGKDRTSKPTGEESDCYKENVKPVKDLKIVKEPPKLLDSNRNSTDNRQVSEAEKPEVCKINKPVPEAVEKSAEEAEKALKNDQQAKIPLKKREIKMTDDFDSSTIRSSVIKSVTPTKEVLKEEGKTEELGLKRASPVVSVEKMEEKQLVNGEVTVNNDVKTHRVKEEPMEVNCQSKPEVNVSSVKEENGIDGSAVKEEPMLSLEQNKSTKNRDEKENVACIEKDHVPQDLEKTVSDLLLKSKKCSSKDGSSQEEKTEVPSKKEATVDETGEKLFPEEQRKVRLEGVALPAADSQLVKRLTKKKTKGVATESTEASAEKSQSMKPPSSEERVEVSSASMSEGNASEELIKEQTRKNSENREPSPPEETTSRDKTSVEKQEDLSKSLEPTSSAPYETDEYQTSKKHKKSSKGKKEPILEGNEISASEKGICIVENKEEKPTPEAPRERIKLTIRVSGRNKRVILEQSNPDPEETVEEEEEKVEADIGNCRALRRSPRISKPTAKVAEIRDKMADKKRAAAEEEEKQGSQKTEKKEDVRKSEKEPCPKASKPKTKSRSRARWTSSRSRRRRRCSSEESEESESEENTEQESENSEKEDSNEKEAEDDEPCKKCSLSNHPELILLCDSCDSGYHTACLRPPLMLIPDGEWFCPPCQHKLLCEKLEEQLQNLDVNLKKRERAERRKERLVYVGISVENIIPPMEMEPEEKIEEKKKDPKKSKALERRSTRTRKCISYRFDEFDEAIDEAIEEDIKEAEGGGGGRGKDMANITGHRGKDISTILEGEGKENQRTKRAAVRRKKRRRLNDLDSDSNLDEEESEDEFKISDRLTQTEMIEGIFMVPLHLFSSQEEDFVASEENQEDSEEEQQSNDDSDFGSRGRKSRRHFYKPTRQSQRLKRTVKRRYSDDDEEETEEEEQCSRSDVSSDYSDDHLDARQRRSRRNQARQVNYKEDSESEGSCKSGFSKRIQHTHKRRLSSSDSDASYLSKYSEGEDPKGQREKRRSPRKRYRSSDDDEENESEEERPIRKRLNRIETDDEEEEEESKESNKENKTKPVFEKEHLPPIQHQPEPIKKPSYRIESDDDGEDFDSVGKDESPLDYSLVDLPSTNGQSPGKTIENLISKSSEKGQAPKDSTSNASSVAPNGMGGQEAIVAEEDEDELLRVTDLVDYVCNSEQL
nr:PREDICTED: remodeling and spacing factor 1 isoform X2 [Latimeria chalumnae]|eukprot:XP_014350221.1 PREDICTED: remodeling and spacing factor 1 isoform X2 [Latimeria chalumnae]